MKRSLTRVVTLVIIAVFALSSVSVCAADLKTGINGKTVNAAAQTQATDNNAASADKTVTPVNAPAEKFAKVSKKVSTAADDSIVIKVLRTAANTKPAYDNGWGLSPNGFCYFEFQAPTTGFLYMDIRTSADNPGGFGEAYLSWYEPSYADYVWYEDDTYYLSSSPNNISSANGKGIYVKEGETYRIYVSNESSLYDYYFDIRAYIYPLYNNRLLPQGSKYYAYSAGYDKNGNVATTWFKVQPTRTGVMAVYLKEFGYSSSYGKVTLYNSTKGTSLSTTVSGNMAYFGVKKGNTYYLKVTDMVGSSTSNYVYGIKYGVTARTDYSIGSKSSAKRLYRTKAKTHALFTAANTNSVDWYKFVVPYKKSTKLYVDTSGMSSGFLTVRVYKGSDYIGKTTVNAGKKWEGTVTYGTSYNKANKGTYYIKVTKSSKASGKYCVRHVY